MTEVAELILDTGDRAHIVADDPLGKMANEVSRNPKIRLMVHSLSSVPRNGDPHRARCCGGIPHLQTRRSHTLSSARPKALTSRVLVAAKSAARPKTVPSDRLSAGAVVRGGAPPAIVEITYCCAGPPPFKSSNPSTIRRPDLRVHLITELQSSLRCSGGPGNPGAPKQRVPPQRRSAHESSPGSVP